MRDHEKPFEIVNHLSSVLPQNGNSAVDAVTLDRLSDGAEVLARMVGRSLAMKAVFSAIRRLGPHKTVVLIEGESGTGKELVAQALHLYGSAPNGPFVTFNSSNLVDALAESQLFGHVRGAFTDAREESLGFFRAAHNGTLFLDEIAELPVRLQAKLLRVVETYEVQPVGSARSYSVDIRLLAATNRNLKSMVKAGQFREDLFYRLNGTSIFIPPLRERPEDVDSLAAHFVARYNQILGKSVDSLSRAALDLLRNHEWPGNARELGNAIERAIIFASTNLIDVPELPIELGQRAPDLKLSGESNVGADNNESSKLLNSIGETIKVALIRSLKESRGNRRRAAEVLGISRSTLYRLLSRYEIM